MLARGGTGRVDNRERAILIDISMVDLRCRCIDEAPDDRPEIVQPVGIRDYRAGCIDGRVHTAGKDEAVIANDRIGESSSETGVVVDALNASSSLLARMWICRKRIGLVDEGI